MKSFAFSLVELLTGDPSFFDLWKSKEYELIAAILFYDLQPNELVALKSIDVAIYSQRPLVQILACPVKLG